MDVYLKQVPGHLLWEDFVTPTLGQTVALRLLQTFLTCKRVNLSHASLYGCLLFCVLLCISNIFGGRGRCVLRLKSNCPVLNLSTAL